MPTRDVFKDKVSVVTGAASGIGYALSQSLLEAGGVVVMVDRDELSLYEAVRSCEGLPGRAQAAIVNVTRQEDVAEMIQNAAASHGRLDYLFNNAGIGWSGPIRDATMETWRRLVDINLWGVIYGVDAALPIMLRQGSGHIINTASMMGLVPGVYDAIYSATKHAVVGLSESLYFELHDDGICVSVVCPGAVATRFFPEGKTPPEAISAKESATTILSGVADKQRLILVPEGLREFWINYYTAPEANEFFFWDLARQRRREHKASRARK
jgi:NAD(P)-dependent dehydrogenase (short-subunit alcohol dehydrogenase family)